MGTAGLVVLVIFINEAPASAADDPCAPANALLDAGLINQADAEFEQLSAEPTSQACADAGLEAVADERIERAETVQNSLEGEVEVQTVELIAELVRSGGEANVADEARTAITAGDGFDIARALKLAGYPDAAAAALTDAIISDPDAEVPTDLQALAAAAGVHLLAAKALANAGLDVEAKEELKLAIQDDPLLDVPEELAASTRRPDVWRDALGTIGPWIRTAVEVLIALAVLVGLLILLLRGIGRLRLRLYAETFVGAKDDAAAAPTTAAVQEEYMRLISGKGGVMLKVIGPSAEPTSQLPKDVVGVIPSGNILIAALVWLVSLVPDPFGRQLTGILRPQDPKRGAGLSLTLARRRGRVFDVVTLWESEFGTLAPQGEKDKAQPAYDHLATPAAAWLMYASYNSRFRTRSRLAKLIQTDELKILGTTSWRSYAQFAVGAKAHLTADWSTARRRYLDAVARDQANQGATFNLAVSELQLVTKDAAYHALAVKRLAALRAVLEEAAQAETENPLWYRVLNIQAVAWIDPDPQRANPEKGRQVAVRLCSNILDGVERIEEREGGDRGELRDFLNGNKPQALVLLASTLLVDNRPPAGSQFQANDLARWLHKLDRGKITVKEFDKYVAHAALVEYVETSLGDAGFECAYNLACYYTRRAQRAEADRRPATDLWSKAGAHLRNAIDLGGAALGTWATQDPVLAAYRADESRRKKLEQIVNERKDPALVGAPTAPDDEDDKDGAGNLLQILRELIT